MKVYNIKSTKEKRISLRRHQTEAEKALWDILKNKRMNGLKFYRQYGIGPYITDFYCPRRRTVIEVDGWQHLSDERKEYDEERQNFMKCIDIKTIRITNKDVLTDLSAVIDYITRQLNNKLPRTFSLKKEGAELFG